MGWQIRDKWTTCWLTRCQWTDLRISWSKFRRCSKPLIRESGVEADSFCHHPVILGQTGRYHNDRGTGDQPPSRIAGSSDRTLCRGGREGKQIIITTYSEFLPLALRRPIKSGLLTLDDIALYHIKKEEEGTIAEKLDLTEDGYVRGVDPLFCRDRRGSAWKVDRNRSGGLNFQIPLWCLRATISEEWGIWRWCVTWCRTGADLQVHEFCPKALRCKRINITTA